MLSQPGPAGLAWEKWRMVQESEVLVMGPIVGPPLPGPGSAGAFSVVSRRNSPSSSTASAAWAVSVRRCQCGALRAGAVSAGAVSAGAVSAGACARPVSTVGRRAG